jgi:hypothetical protein
MISAALTSMVYAMRDAVRSFLELTDYEQLISKPDTGAIQHLLERIVGDPWRHREALYELVLWRSRAAAVASARVMSASGAPCIRRSAMAFLLVARPDLSRWSKTIRSSTTASPKWQGR